LTIPRRICCLKCQNKINACKTHILFIFIFTKNLVKLVPKMEALTWLHCLVVVSGLVGNTTALANDEGHDLVVLLLDRRLTKTKGCHLASFVGGGVLAFLSATALFPDSTVLAAVPPDTLEAFTSLIRHAPSPIGRRFKLLFRSTRDGALAAAFHGRCDAKGPTLTLIKDTVGNVFGGYTSLHWSSPADDACLWLDDPRAFVFTVVNPHGDPPALFTKNFRNVYCQSSKGPCFSGLRVCGAFERLCCTYIGGNYANPTRHRGFEVLTGVFNFAPAEVEVWGLADD
jgi:hypothetical protein